MNSVAGAAIASWTLEPGVTIPLAITALLYLRGWWRLRFQAPHRFPPWRLGCFFSGILVLFLAITSPLDAFARFLLTVHMIQHLLLTMVAPPLLLAGAPFLPILVGLPRMLMVEGVGPFLTWKPLKKLGAFLTHPAFCLGVFMLSNVAWHVPFLYELALRSPSWHRVEHVSFFLTALLFWWPVVQPWPSRPRWPRWAMIPYLLLADIQNTALAAGLTFFEKILYPTYAQAPRLSAFSAIDDQSAAGAIMWVPGSMLFLIPAGIIMMTYLSPKRPTPTPRPIVRPMRRSCSRPIPPSWDALRVPFLGRFLQTHGRTVLQSLLLMLAILVIWDGFTGPQISAMNLAGVLPWTHWRGFTVLALLLAGNLFCMACPFMLVRDGIRHTLQRFLRFRPRQTWPRALRSKWLPAILLLLYLWAYEAFSLWNNPWWTAMLVLGYFGFAALIDSIFKGASFCKYVCPIGQFHFVQSLVSPMEVRVREPEACRTCRTYDCIRGNTFQRGCELQLFQPRKSGNMDCTFCLDCVKACPKDNVGILATVSASNLWTDRPRSSVGQFSNRPDLAALVAILTVGAFTNAAGMITPTLWLQQQLNLSHIAFTTLFLAVFLVFLPALFLPAIAVISRPGDPGASLRSILCRNVVALAPLGFGMWLAHFVFHLFTGSHAPIPVIQRLFGSASPDWNISSWAWSGLLGIEILFLDAGYLLALYVLWRIVRSPQRPAPRPLRLFCPWALLATILYLAGIWILFQPMEMRGTLLPG